MGNKEVKTITVDEVVNSLKDTEDKIAEIFSIASVEELKKVINLENVKRIKELLDTYYDFIKTQEKDAIRRKGDSVLRLYKNLFIVFPEDSPFPDFFRSKLFHFAFEKNFRKVVCEDYVEFIDLFVKYHIFSTSTDVNTKISKMFKYLNEMLKEFELPLQDNSKIKIGNLKLEYEKYSQHLAGVVKYMIEVLDVSNLVFYAKKITAIDLKEATANYSFRKKIIATEITRYSLQVKLFRFFYAGVQYVENKENLKQIPNFHSYFIFLYQLSTSSHVRKSLIEEIFRKDIEHSLELIQNVLDDKTFYYLIAAMMNSVNSTKLFEKMFDSPNGFNFLINLYRQHEKNNPNNIFFIFFLCLSFPYTIKKLKQAKEDPEILFLDMKKYLDKFPKENFTYLNMLIDSLLIRINNGLFPSNILLETGLFEICAKLLQADNENFYFNCTSVLKKFQDETHARNFLQKQENLDVFVNACHFIYHKLKFDPIQQRVDCLVEMTYVVALLFSDEDFATTAVANGSLYQFLLKVYKLSLDKTANPKVRELQKTIPLIFYHYPTELVSFPRDCNSLIKELQICISSNGKSENHVVNATLAISIIQNDYIKEAKILMFSVLSGSEDQSKGSLVQGLLALSPHSGSNGSSIIEQEIMQLLSRCLVIEELYLGISFYKGRIPIDFSAQTFLINRGDIYLLPAKYGISMSKLKFCYHKHFITEIFSKGLSNLGQSFTVVVTIPIPNIRKSCPYNVLLQGDVGCGGWFVYANDIYTFGLFDEETGEFKSFGINVQKLKLAPNWYDIVVAYEFIKNSGDFYEYKVEAYLDGHSKGVIYAKMKSSIKYIGNSAEMDASWGVLGELVIFKRKFNRVDALDAHHGILKGVMQGYRNSLHNQIIHIIDANLISRILLGHNNSDKIELAKLIMLLIPFQGFWPILYNERVAKALESALLQSSPPLNALLAYIVMRM